MTTWSLVNLNFWDRFCRNVFFSILGLILVNAMFVGCFVFCVELTNLILLWYTLSSHYFLRLNLRS